MFARLHLPGRPSLALLVSLILSPAAFAGCTSEGAQSQTTTVADDSTELTTTTAAPIVLATAADLGLPIGECWNELAVASTTTSTSSPVPTSEGETTTSTQPTTTQTTVPTPDIVAVVDCAGTNQGEVYANFCMGLDPELDDDVESASGALISDALIRVPCPGDDEVLWPGDREVRRAAARLCLDVFSIVFQESYAVSERSAREMTPNEGLWERGERRVACSATQPPPPTTTTAAN